MLEIIATFSASTLSFKPYKIACLIFVGVIACKTTHPREITLGKEFLYYREKIY